VTRINKCLVREGHDSLSQQTQNAVVNFLRLLAGDLRQWRSSRAKDSQLLLRPRRTSSGAPVFMEVARHSKRV